MPQVNQTVQTFLTLIVPVGCLALVYFLGRIKPIGRFYSVLLIPPGKLCFALSDLLSAFAVKREKGVSTYPGLRTIVLLIALGFAVVALASDGYNTLQALPAIWPDATFTPPTLPVFFTYSMGWLFLSLPALTGMIWLEQKVALEVKIFTVPQVFQKQFERFIFLTFVLSLLSSLAFNALKPSFTADNTSMITLFLQICVFVLMGGLLPLVMALTVYILALGLQAVVSLMFTMAWFLSSMSADLIDFLVLDFTGNERSITDTHKGIRVIDRSSTVTIVPEQYAHLSLTEPAEASDATTDEVVPIETQELEKVTMRNPTKSVSIVTTGDYGWQMRSYLPPTIARFHADDRVLTSGHIGVSAVSHMQSAIPGTVEISPTPVERHTATLHGETEGHINNTLMCCIGNKLAATHVIAQASQAPLLFLTDSHHLVDGIGMHETLSQRLPLHPQVVVTSVSAQNAGNNIVAAGLSDLNNLAAEDIIAHVIVTDPRSPFALHYGEETLNQFLALFLVCLIIAQNHSPRNGSSISLLQTLRSLSPFSTLSFASEPVAVGEVPMRWLWVPFVKGHAGVGNLSDTLAGTRTAIEKVFRDEKSRAFPAEVHTDASCVVICTAPYARNDPRFHECVRSNKMYLGSHYPYATCLTVSGNGCSHPYHLGSKFLVTAMLLYPLSPASLPEVQAGKQPSMTSISPDPEAISSTNRNTPTEPVTETKHTPVVESQPKIAAPARRGRQKQTKAGK